MKMPITRRMVDTTPLIPGGYNPTLTKCSECKKRFERLSEKWVYHFRKDGKDTWQCSWRCHRAAEARLYPKKALRGEYFAEHELENAKKYQAAAKARALANKG